MTPVLDTEFREFVDNPSSDELSAALLVNLVLDPAIDSSALRAKVDALANACPDDVPPWAFLKSQGFHSVGKASSSLAHSKLADVLETGQGIPISLGVLLVHVARRRGLTAQGINFPGHFLTRMDERLVDPLSFKPITEQDCLQKLTGRLPENPFAVATSTMIALRMLNNVKAHLAEAFHWDRVLHALSLQLILMPDSAELLYERGQVWEMLGAPDAARESYQQVMEKEVDSKLREEARRKIAHGGEDTTLWH